MKSGEIGIWKSIRRRFNGGPVSQQGRENWSALFDEDKRVDCGDKECGLCCVYYYV